MRTGTMGRDVWNVYLLMCYLTSMVYSYKVASGTSKPRFTKYSSPTPSPPVTLAAASLVTPVNEPVTPGEGIATYSVKNSNGAICILLRTDALIEINFESHVGEEKGDSYLPEKPTVEGSCGNEDTATMKISWNEYTLIWYFAKTPGGERWYTDLVELIVSTDVPQYHNIKTHGSTFKLVHKQMLFPTPVGKSYSCSEVNVDLVPAVENAPKGLSGTLFLRAFQLQPFMYKGANFGPSFECNATKGFRSETAPIAVGSTLAVAVLLTVTGYGVYRYFKIKKVQYNTME